MYLTLFMCRNYHVFYYLLLGVNEEERKEFHLKQPEDYSYLNQVICTRVYTCVDNCCLFLMLC